MNSSIAMPLSTTTRRSRWPLVLATMVVLALGAVLLAWGALSALNPIPMNVTVDGERVLNGLDLAALAGSLPDFALIASSAGELLH